VGPLIICEIFSRNEIVEKRVDLIERQKVAFGESGKIGREIRKRAIEPMNDVGKSVQKSLWLLMVIQPAAQSNEFASVA
jgi:hypothetical protein